MRLPHGRLRRRDYKRVILAQRTNADAERGGVAACYKGVSPAQTVGSNYMQSVLVPGGRPRRTGRRALGSPDPCMRALPIASAVFAAAAVASPPTEGAPSESATGTLQISVDVRSRTSLHVSTQVLQFHVTAPAEPATGVIEFIASSRTREGGEVLLATDAVRGTPADMQEEDAVLTFRGHGHGLTVGALNGPGTAIVGRWIGSGRRSGRVAFVLRARRAGTYTVPIRLVLSCP
jgi:hypothetical protein